LLDEPPLGLAPIIVAKLFNVIYRLRNEGTTILLVEQNARQALTSSDRTYVIQVRRIVLEGFSRNLLADEQVVKAYMGGSN
jgi:branched-chain amino acid transport system ATP-binding protein